MQGKPYDCACGRTHAPWWGLHVQAPSCTLTYRERVHDAFFRLMREVQKEQSK